MSDDSAFTPREMNLISQLALHEAALTTLETVITCLVARNGGAVVIEHDEIMFSKKTYMLEKEMKSDDTRLKMVFTTRLK